MLVQNMTLIRAHHKKARSKEYYRPGIEGLSLKLDMTLALTFELTWNMAYVLTKQVRHFAIINGANAS